MEWTRIKQFRRWFPGACAMCVVLVLGTLHVFQASLTTNFKSRVNQNRITLHADRSRPGNIRTFPEIENSTKQPYENVKLQWDESFKKMHGIQRETFKVKRKQSVNVDVTESSESNAELQKKKTTKQPRSVSSHTSLAKFSKNKQTLSKILQGKDNHESNRHTSTKTFPDEGPTNTYRLLATNLSRSSTCRCVRDLPRALIIGAPKCGTTALATYLSMHPYIAIYGGIELNFFSNNYDEGFQWYLGKMPCSLPGQFTMERSSNYFHIPGVPERVKTMNKDTKLVLTVCEPVRRTVSAFSMYRASGKAENKSFEEHLFIFQGDTLKLNASHFIVKASEYSEYLPSWLRLFPFANLHIVDGDNLSKQPFQEISAVEKFLNVHSYFEEAHFIFNETKGFFCVKKQTSNMQHVENGAQKVADITKRNETSAINENIKCLSERKGQKHVEVKDVYTNMLRHFYKPFNEKFYKLTRRKFNW